MRYTHSAANSFRFAKTLLPSCSFVVHDLHSLFLKHHSFSVKRDNLYFNAFSFWHLVVCCIVVRRGVGQDRWVGDKVGLLLRLGSIIFDDGRGKECGFSSASLTERSLLSTSSWPNGPVYLAEAVLARAGTIIPHQYNYK